MTSIPNTLSLLPFQYISPQNQIPDARAYHSANLRLLWSDSRQSRCSCRRSKLVLLVRASGDPLDSGDTGLAGNGNRFDALRNMVVSENRDSALRGMISALPPAIFVIKRSMDSKLAVGLCIAFTFFAIAVRQIMVKKQSHNHHGSVADLVRRGQLRSDRRGISKPLKYEDPFNNPLVKVGKSNSTIEMCGKVYRLAPVTLTREEQSIHQKRRSRAYQWKRPTVFLKEGDSIPPDVDPDAIRWIPSNHPFATTISDIDENLAQSNVYQKHGVPFRVRAEHEAMQKRLEALQNQEQRLSKMDLERPFRSSSKPHDPMESNSSDHKYSDNDSKPDDKLDSFDDQTLPNEVKKLPEC